MELLNRLIASVSQFGRAVATSFRAHAASFLILFCLIAVVLIVWARFGFSLEIGRFFASEPAVEQTVQTTTEQATDGDTTVNVEKVSCAPLIQTVTVGTPATLTANYPAGPVGWYSHDGTQWTSSWGESAGNNVSTYTVTYTTPGTKKVLVVSNRGIYPDYGITDVVSCTVTVNPAATTN